MTSASQLGRFIACPPSDALPSSTEQHIPGAAVARQRGNVVHDFLVACGQVGRREALRWVEENHADHSDICEAIDVLRMPVDRAEFAHEVAFAFDPSTGKARELGRLIGREYHKAGLLPHEIPGTADVVGIRGDEVYVPDYKTGHSEPDEMQIMALILFACRAYGKDRGSGGFIRIKPDGSAYRSKPIEMHALDLDLLADQIRTAVQERDSALELISAGEEPTVSPGPHCKYCPAAMSCPAQTKILATLRDPSALASALELRIATQEDARHALATMRAYDMIAKKVWSAIYAFAKAQPIDLGNGKKFGEHEGKPRETLNGSVVYGILLESWGADVALQATTLSATKKDLDDALRPIARASGKPLAALRREVLARIREEGGSEIKRTMTVGEYDGE